MQVTGRGLQIAMAEQQLNGAQIGARVEQMGGKGVAQHMRAERLDHAQLAAQFLADQAHPAIPHRLVRQSPGKEPVLGLAPTPVDTQQLRWNETILYSFAGSPDGAHPYAGLLWDSAGNLYGTTEQGGTHAAGTVFMLAPNPDGRWTESVLYTFTGQNDGANPDAGLAFDSSGNLYGTTTGGGAGSRGTVFKLSRSVGGQWTETVLHSFDLQDGSDPSNLGSLVVDAAGNLYGTTIDGGQYGLGVVFEVSP